MEVSGETGGITGMQDGGQEAEPGAGMADTGILSYDSESAQAKEHAGTLPGGAEAMAADYAGGLDSPASSVQSGLPGTSTAGALSLIHIYMAVKFISLKTLFHCR